MATYIELHNLRSSDALLPLRQKIDVALAIRANALAKSGTATAAQKSFSLQALKDSGFYTPTVLSFILAEYNTQTVAVIISATDAQVQAAVDKTITTLLGA